MTTMTTEAAAPAAKTKPAKAKAGGLRDMAETRGELLHIDPRKIKIAPGFNARDFNHPANKEHVESLASSIAEVGVLNPLTVRLDKDGSIYLVDGESRYRATLLAIERGAAIKTVPATAERKDTSEEDRIATLVTRNTGKRLEPLEQANVFKRLRDFGWNDSEIARKVGVTGPYIAGLMKLYAAPAEVKAYVSAGKIAAATVVSILRDETDPKKAQQIISDAVAEAAMNNKEKATPKHVTAAKERKAGTTTEPRPIRYNKSIVDSLIYTLATIAGDTSLGPIRSGPRAVAKDALQNADVDWRSILKEYETVEEDDD